MTHHLVSSREWACFLDMEWTVLAWRQIDTLLRGWVYDQFPLPLKETVAIAREMGVRHPAFSGVLWQMSTDVVGHAPVAGELIWLPRTCKTDASFDERTIAKLEIERRYWSRRGAQLLPFTESDIDEPRLRCLEAVRPFFSLDEVTNPPVHVRSDLTAAWAEVLRKTAADVRLSTVCSALDQQFQMMRGGAQAMLFHLIATQVLRTDFSYPLTLRRPVGAVTWRNGALT